MYQGEPGAALVNVAISVGVSRSLPGFTEMKGSFFVPLGAVLGSGL